MAVNKHNSTGADARAAIYYIENANSQSGAGNWTISTGDGDIVLIEVIGAQTSSVLDVTASDSGSSATVSSGTTAAGSTSLSYAISAMSVSSTTITLSDPTNGYTELADVSVAETLAVHRLLIHGASATGHTATASGSGVWAGCVAQFKMVDDTSVNDTWLVADNTAASTVEIWALNGGISAGTWSMVESISTNLFAVPVHFAVGLGGVVYTHPGFSTARFWNYVTPSAITDAPPGQCVAFHKNRFFIGGTLTNPSRLYYSEIGDKDTWLTGTAGSIDVGEDDGEAIRDIAVFQDGLVIGKKTSLWYLTGAGPDSFRLIRLDGGGAAPGRSIRPTPYGCLIAGETQVWLYAGGAVDMISRPVRESYGLTGNWMETDYTDTTAYILDEGSGTVWMLDFQTGTWAEEIIGSASTEGAANILSYGKTQVFAPKNATVGSLLNYRFIPGDARDKDFDTLSQTFTAWTPEMWLVGPQEKFTPRYLFLKLRQRGGDEFDSSLFVTPYFDGNAGTPLEIKPWHEAGVYWDRKSLAEDGLAKGISYLQLRISQTLESTEAAVFDIKEAVIGYLVKTVA